MNHYWFFNCLENNCIASRNNTYLLSSTSASSKTSIKGSGTYVCPDNIRRAIALFGVRSLTKTKWENAYNVYIGREG